KIKDSTVGPVNRQKEEARLDVVGAGKRNGPGSPQQAEGQRRFQGGDAQAGAAERDFNTQNADLNKENDRLKNVLVTADGKEKTLTVGDIVRAYPANQLGFVGKSGLYLSRWWEFLTDEPRNANMEGGVFPAIWGTAAMTIVMSLVVVPFGVLAAL